jgi:signal transduction histidine kinase
MTETTSTSGSADPRGDEPRDDGHRGDARDRTSESSSWSAPLGTPVPPAPQPAGPTPPRDLQSLIAAADQRISAAGLPFDSLRTGIEWWYRPFVEAKTWVALGWLFVGAVWGVLAFAAVVVTATLVFVLSLGLVGLLLVVPAFALVNALATLERRRAGWVGDPIEPPHLSRAGKGALSPFITRLGDAARWRQVLFFVVFGIAGPFFLALAAAPWGFLVGNVFGADFDIDAFSLVGLVFAALLAGIAPRVTVGVAWVARSFIAALLGPTDSAELRERVTELSGQRQQILDAVAEERRRIERNLHDGVQQQLVALGIDIGRASSRLESDPDGARALLDDARSKVRGSIGELRLIGRGLHPAVLEDRGLDAALSAVVASSPIPIRVDVTSQVALPADVASTAYYVASEAVANILKHAQARVASIRLDDDRLDDGRQAVRLTVHDDGCGGADASRGTGLAGIRARVEGVDGVFRITSPLGGPTTLVVVVPIERSMPEGRPS